MGNKKFELQIKPDMDVGLIQRIVINTLSVNEFKFIQSLANQNSGMVTAKFKHDDNLYKVEIENHVIFGPPARSYMKVFVRLDRDIWKNLQPENKALPYQDYEFESFEELHEIITENKYDLMDTDG